MGYSQLAVIWDFNEILVLNWNVSEKKGVQLCSLLSRTTLQSLQCSQIWSGILMFIGYMCLFAIERVSCFRFMCVCVLFSSFSLFLFSFSNKNIRYSSVNDIFEERAVKLGRVPFVRQPQCINGPHPSSWPMTLLTVLFLRNLPTLQLPLACWIFLIAPPLHRKDGRAFSLAHQVSLEC